MPVLLVNLPKCFAEFYCKKGLTTNLVNKEKLTATFISFHRHHQDNEATGMNPIYPKDMATQKVTCLQQDCSQMFVSFIVCVRVCKREKERVQFII